MATVNTMEIEGSQYEIEDSTARASIETLTTGLTAVAEDVAVIKAGAAYSTSEEVFTGQRWVDGKKLYRKVLFYSASPANNTTLMEGVDTLVNCYGSQVYRNVSQLGFPVILDSSTWSRADVEPATHKLRYLLAGYAATYITNIYIVVEYTKVSESA